MIREIIGQKSPRLVALAD